MLWGMSQTDLHEITGIAHSTLRQCLNRDEIRAEIDAGPPTVLIDNRAPLERCMARRGESDRCWLIDRHHA